MIEKYAYATVMGGQNYINCTLGCLSSFIRTKSKYPFIIFIAEDTIEKNTLENFINLIKEISPKIIIKKFTSKNFKNNLAFKFTLNKFEILNLINYEKILFVDADIIFFKNLDFIFKKYKNLGIKLAVNNIEFNHDFKEKYTKTKEAFTDDLNSKLKPCIDGEILLLKPNVNLYNLIHENYTNCLTDEDILFELFFDYLSKENIITIDRDKYYFHCRGEKLLSIFNSKDIQYIINNFLQTPN